MKSILALCCLTCMVLLPGLLSAQENTLATPEASAGHAILKKDIGIWDAEIKIWLPGQGDQPMLSKGTETNKMVGDFWIVNQFDYEMMGQTFGGHGVFGFDPASGKYSGTWYSSDSPTAIPMEGQWDESTKTMTMSMDGTDSFGNPIKGKTVSTYVDDNHKTFEMHLDLGDGEMHKMMEVRYTRK